MTVINLIISGFKYYMSFWNIFCLQHAPMNDLDLFHWSLYQYFALYQKASLSHIEDFLWCFKMHPFGKRVFNRWLIVIISLLGPCIMIYLALFDDKIFAHCMDKPDKYWFYIFIKGNFAAVKQKSCLKWIKNELKYGRTSCLPISPAYNHYLYHKCKNRYLSQNKHLFYLFCNENNIPTINCILSIEQLKECKSQEYIVKESVGGRGMGTFSTKQPEKYLSKLPNIVIQPRVTNHKQIVDFTGIEITLCTFRCCTYTEEANLQPEAWLSVPLSDNCLTDHDVSAAYIYDIQNKVFKKRLDSEYPMIIASKNGKDIHSVEIDGLDEFILFLNDVHHKYFDALVAIGWDMTKISTGEWVIVECNPSFINKISVFIHKQDICFKE
eukprot:366516_1